eukprot:6189827-Pleurochrysis_carterae.AAC.2
MHSTLAVGALNMQQRVRPRSQPLVFPSVTNICLLLLRQSLVTARLRVGHIDRCRAQDEAASYRKCGAAAFRNRSTSFEI